jgi:hypothetical protein
MPSKKPQVSIRLDVPDFDYLEQWAAREFMNPTQLVKILVRRALAEDRKKYLQEIDGVNERESA